MKEPDHNSFILLPEFSKSQEMNLSRFVNLSIHTQHPQTTYYNRFHKEKPLFPHFLFI
jgi:hypothetical protein